MLMLTEVVRKDRLFSKYKRKFNLKPCVVLLGDVKTYDPKVYKLVKQKPVPITDDVAVTNIVKDSRRFKYKCTRCVLRFKDYRQLKEHMSVHETEQVFVDEEDDEEEEDSKSDEVVISTSDSEEDDFDDGSTQQLFPCNFCNKEFKYDYTYAKHLKRHKLLACIKCNKVVKSKVELDRHLEVEHNYCPCPECPQLFYSQTNLAMHLSSKHAKKNYLCSTCGHKFETAELFKEHQKAHEHVTCDLCQAQFKSERALNKHQATHFGKLVKLAPKASEAFRCNVCGVKFIGREFLEQHLKEHIGESEDAAAPPVEKVEAAKMPALIKIEAAQAGSTKSSTPPPQAANVKPITFNSSQLKLVMINEQTYAILPENTPPVNGTIKLLINDASGRKSVCQAIPAVPSLQTIAANKPANQLPPLKPADKVIMPTIVKVASAADAVNMVSNVGINTTANGLNAGVTINTSAPVIGGMSIVQSLPALSTNPGVALPNTLGIQVSASGQRVYNIGIPSTAAIKFSTGIVPANVGITTTPQVVQQGLNIGLVGMPPLNILSQPSPNITGVVIATPNAPAGVAATVEEPTNTNEVVTAKTDNAQVSSCMAVSTAGSSKTVTTTSTEKTVKTCARAGDIKLKKIGYKTKKGTLKIISATMGQPDKQDANKAGHSIAVKPVEKLLVNIPKGKYTMKSPSGKVISIIRKRKQQGDGDGEPIAGISSENSAQNIKPSEEASEKAVDPLAESDIITEAGSKLETLSNNPAAVVDGVGAVTNLNEELPEPVMEVESETANAEPTVATSEVSKEAVPSDEPVDAAKPKIFVKPLCQLLQNPVEPKAEDPAETVKEEEPKSPKIRKLFKCTECNSVCKRELKLLQHRTKYRCKLCDFGSCKLKVLDVHYSDKHEYRNRCVSCDTQFPSLTDLQHHKKSVHLCKQCNRCYFDLNKHQNNYRCSNCEFFACSASGLDAHYKQVHRIMTRCAPCDMTFYSQETFQHHKQEIHYCERCCTFKMDLNVHKTFCKGIGQAAFSETIAVEEVIDLDSD